ncbi:MAG: treY [Verrucomicrobiaceae bacterium]|nr:treY [Verrucomicrobiaceae bacterium]
MNSSPPRATYRLQFHEEFRFQDGTSLVPYLRDLGISHVYASPIFRAGPHSRHGYDICDHNELNPEIGTREEFDAFVDCLHQNGMGLILDFVPNHMGIADQRNPWWWDVLENGHASPFARYFDIEWRPLKPALENKVLLPILGDQYGRVLEGGDFKIQFDAGAFTLHYHDTVLPLDPQSTRVILRRAEELMTPVPDELASILTALDNLPSRTEFDPARVTERSREKGIIRERLGRLYQENASVQESIGSALAEWCNNSGGAAGYDRLDALLSSQPYRLSYWRVAAEEINYRRFFDINTLAAICVELPEVFEATHRLLLQLVTEGKVDGVRIDHIDGLALPLAYLETLSTRLAEASGGTPYLVVEKILGKDESLPAGWPIHGTTGYEFAIQALQVLVDPAAERPLTECYEKATGRSSSYREVIYDSKRLIMEASMASELNMLGILLSRVAESHRWYRDFTVNALTAAVREVIACFPVYRSYLVPGCPPSEADGKVIISALAQARRRNPALERSVFEFLRHVLLPPAEDLHPVDEELRRAFVTKFQQCTSPIMAKGVEDTAFYLYNRHVALNEVGGNPGAYGMTVEQFHRQCQARLAEFPHSMLALSTHDTKRSEDVRARIAALSELPHEWAAAVRRWRVINRKFKTELEGEAAPDDNEEFLLYQTLLGSWPLQNPEGEALQGYIQRLQDYMVKALHEAKVNSSWIEPNERWDEAVKKFVAAILTPDRQHRFQSAFEPLAQRIAELGMVNSLAQTVLKFTLPGMPDTYQGTEVWDFSLVDPDNRRAVDYSQRRDLLTAGGTPDEMLRQWRDGRIKLAIVRHLLQLRAAHPELFSKGSYEPLLAEGTHAAHCIAFERKLEAATLLVVVPRLSGDLGFPPVGACWNGTHLLPSARTARWKNVLTGTAVQDSGTLSLSELLADWPVAVLVSESQ